MLSTRGHIKAISVKVDGNTSDLGVYVQLKLDKPDLKALAGLTKQALTIDFKAEQLVFGKGEPPKKDAAAGKE